MTPYDLAGRFQNLGSHLSVSCQGRCVVYFITVNVDFAPFLRAISARFLYCNYCFSFIINNFLRGDALV